ncbi:MAG: GIY-YIG nuclease family protein [Saprospirales bacterium]|nr:GIY-YIG nuclease family protein [Saprospirales bacterium]
MGFFIFVQFYATLHLYPSIPGRCFFLHRLYFNISRRLQEHNAGLSSFTSRKIPWRLVYFEDFDDKSDALKRERFIKAMRNKNFILNLIRSF